MRLTVTQSAPLGLMVVSVVVAFKKFHVRPLSVLLKMPMPANPAELSPVPAYITLELDGSMTKVPMARLPMKSATGENDSPPSIVNQMPPDAEPTKMRDELRGSMTMARMRPPTLPGPRKVHCPLLMPAALLPPDCARPCASCIARRTRSAAKICVLVGRRPKSSASQVRMYSRDGARAWALFLLRYLLR